MIRNRFAAALLLLTALPLAATESGPVARDHVVVELLSEVETIRPGQAFRLGLAFDHEPAWHSYWRNPGDSGLETKLRWILPEGFEAGSIQWPWPERIEVEHLVNYGYSGRLLLPVAIVAPSNLAPGPVRLTLRADWLVCKIECIPGSAELTVELTASEAPPEPSAHADRFAATDARIARTVDWPAEFSTDSGMLSVQVRDAPPLSFGALEWFVAEPALVEHAASAFIDGVDGTLQLSQPLSPFFSAAPERLEMLLVDRAAGRGWRLEATSGRFETAAPLSDGEGSVEILPLGVLLLMALAGGVLLNLMPCVFPVLSIKAVSLVSAGTAQRAHAAAYTLGVLVSFALLAGALLGLRAGGEAIGWGFQLQTPWFVALLVYLLFALALSLSGLFEFGGSFGGLGQRLTERPGLGGSFFTGVLAAVVASPCTAPFMGTALGLAVLLPGAQAMLVFLSLGLGLALPLAAIGFIPALARKLPRPGPWMVTFRQAMAFPLYLTVVWLLWVLGRQTGADGVTAVLVGLVALAFALWLAGRQSRRGVLESLRHVAVAFALIAALAAVGAANRLLPDESEPAETWWEPWSEQRLDELVSTPGQPVFVNMTADWCVTCLVNERVALDKDIVREAFAEAGVVYLKGDWTRRDPAITRYLEQFDRNGVPLYVYYPGDGTQPTVLPQLLSPSTVLEAIGI